MQTIVISFEDKQPLDGVLRAIHQEIPDLAQKVSRIQSQTKENRPFSGGQGNRIVLLIDFDASDPAAIEAISDASRIAKAHGANVEIKVNRGSFLEKIKNLLGEK